MGEHMNDRKKRIYDFTEGLQRAKQRIDDDDIGNRAVIESEDEEIRPRSAARPPPRGPSEEELAVNAALAITVNDTMSEEDLSTAKTTIERALELLALMCGSIKGQIDEATER